MNEFSAANIFVTSFGLFVTSIQIACGVLHVRQFKQFRRESKFRKALIDKSALPGAASEALKWKKVAVILTYITLVLYIIASIMLTWHVGIPAAALSPTDTYCTWKSATTYFVYHLTDTVFYALSIARTQIIFANIRYEYSSNSKKIVYPSFTMLFIFIILATYGDFFQVTSTYRADLKRGSGCKTAIPGWLLGLTILFDGGFSIFCLYLLVKPLSTISITQSKFQRIIEKYFVLGGVAIVSSLLLSFCGIAMNRDDVIQHTIFSSMNFLDFLTNTVCILLFSSVNDKYFNKLCCGITVFCNHRRAQLEYGQAMARGQYISPIGTTNNGLEIVTNGNGMHAHTHMYGNGKDNQLGSGTNTNKLILNNWQSNSNKDREITPFTGEPSRSPVLESTQL